MKRHNSDDKEKAKSDIWPVQLQRQFNLKAANESN